jgi:branched-chain amino acid aminotransferase
MSVIWKDGQFFDGLQTHISHDDAGLVNGLGIFDSMLAKDGILIDAREHFERIVHDAHIVLGYDSSWMPTLAGMSEVWQPLLAQNNLNRGYARVKTIVTGGISMGPLTVSSIPSVIVSVGKSGAPEDTPPALCAIIRDFPRVAGDRLENCKRLDYSRSFAARNAAKALGANEAIMVSTNGNIACGATSNIFIREAGKLITPPLSDGVLAGVRRRKILERGEAVEEVISEERLKRADEIFLTNSFVGMRKATLL